MEDQINKLVALPKDPRLVSVGLAFDAFGTSPSSIIDQLWEIVQNKSLSTVTMHTLGGPWAAALGTDRHFTYFTHMSSQARLWLEDLCDKWFQEVLDDVQIPVNNSMTVEQAFTLITRAGGLAPRRPDLGNIAPVAKAALTIFDGETQICWVGSMPWRLLCCSRVFAISSMCLLVASG
ncbi:hypothetical protein BKA66DRAFT_577448 [Pyrenochaeta sp. MPI-SDFR-AT-0127]|nr:hypothetical protein BKA66DRAFT_577448 [Pyrenochaeta sp. MPI-SDFR-AT-0127]